MNGEQPASSSVFATALSIAIQVFSAADENVEDTLFVQFTMHDLAIVLAGLGLLMDVGPVEGAIDRLLAGTDVSGDLIADTYDVLAKIGDRPFELLMRLFELLRAQKGGEETI
jgi:hypothetical protein